MRVLVCPTAFKEGMSALQAAEAMAAGVRRAIPSALCSIVPVSDGGPGLIEAILEAEEGQLRPLRVQDPLGRRVEARILWTNQDEAVVEAAESCGLHLLSADERDPLRTHTSGVGELLGACLALGARRVWLGLGGSATVDGGTGLARTFGYRFLDDAGQELPLGGGALERLARIEGGEAPAARITALADVRSPLLGPDGAARRFAPQKGAGPTEVETLERGLTRLAERMEQDLAARAADLPGAGAAGGLGAGCRAFLGAELRMGAEWVLARTDFEEHLARSDLIVTGEGAYDGSSTLGKIVHEVLARATRAGVPIVLACGTIHGAAPDGVHAVDGRGAWLDAEALTSMVAAAVPKAVRGAGP